MKQLVEVKPAQYIDQPKFYIQIPGYDPLLESDGQIRENPDDNYDKDAAEKAESDAEDGFKD